jgi:F0F1-type ATP synthase epsilon subunit
MSKNLHLEITSPNGILFQGECYLVTIPSIDGEIGAMQGHEMVVSMLKRDSEINIFDENNKIIKTINVENGGFAEMQGEEKLLVLID